jgi:hypothetical protein
LLTQAILVTPEQLKRIGCRKTDCLCGNEKRMAHLIAETLPTRVLRDEAEVRAATALIAVDVGAAVYTGIPGRHACLIRLAGQPETSQRHSYNAASKSFQSLPPRYGLGHTFGQLIEFIVHNSCLLFVRFWS